MLSSEMGMKSNSRFHRIYLWIPAPPFQGNLVSVHWRGGKNQDHHHSREGGGGLSGTYVSTCILHTSAGHEQHPNLEHTTVATAQSLSDS